MATLTCGCYWLPAPMGRDDLAPNVNRAEAERWWKSQLSPSKMLQGDPLSAPCRRVCKRWHPLSQGISDGLQEEGHLSWTGLGKWMGNGFCHSVSAYQPCAITMCHSIFLATPCHYPPSSSQGCKCPGPNSW